MWWWFKCAVWSTKALWMGTSSDFNFQKDEMYFFFIISPGVQSNAP